MGCNKFSTCIAPDLNVHQIDCALSDGDLALAIILRDVPFADICTFYPTGSRFYAKAKMLLRKFKSRKAIAQKVVDSIVVDIAALADYVERFSDLPFVVCIPQEDVYATCNMEHNENLYQKMHDLQWVDFSWTPDVVLWLRDVHESLMHCDRYHPDKLVREEIVRWFNLDPECRADYLPVESDSLSENSESHEVICHALYEIKTDGCMSHHTFVCLESLLRRYVS